MGDLIPLPEELFRSFKVGKKLSEMEYCGSFLSTPSGPSHLRNILTALMPWLFVRLNGGKWFLRFDYLDIPRHRKWALEKFLDELTWFGLELFEKIICQRKRIDIYNSVLEALKSANKINPCRGSQKN
ncbi:glutamate--tRNA ligase family protein [Prochlorococcus sp. MIT 1223]|uniref:glutamate--tRNA ligase family protein n=1 Tax=Prochlorococcus sp. MIT 1223 TaxID=3096217 RepID=UPI002A755045|nr:glutamate--tRNA ligase family protein [Prochlorococcus sp. MIT 1223]